MANVIAVNTYRFNTRFPMELAGKMRTYLKGRKSPAREITGRGIRKEFRQMTPSDYLVGLAERDLSDIAMDAESREWVAREMQKNIKFRDRTIAENKAKRKDPSEYEKPGPKPGKTYPKFLAAMKKLAAERKAAKAKPSPAREKGKTKRK